MSHVCLLDPSFENNLITGLTWVGAGARLAVHGCAEPRRHDWNHHLKVT